MKNDTLMNKILALLLMAAGYLTTLPEHDITFFVITLLLGVPLFFSKENHIV